MASGGCLAQMAQRLKSHSLAGCRPLDACYASSRVPSGHSSPFLSQTASSQKLLHGKSLSPHVGQKACFTTKQSVSGVRSQAAKRASSSISTSFCTVSKLHHQTISPFIGITKGTKRSVQVQANGGDFDFDGDDDVGDIGGENDDGFDEIDVDFEYGGTVEEEDREQGDDEDAYAGDEEAVNVEDDDFDVEDYEMMGSDMIGVDDLDDMISADGLGDTSKVRRVPYKIDEDYYHKLQCHKPPFDFYIRKDEQGFLNLSQIYGGEPYAERYVIPSISGETPNEFHRYQMLKWHTISAREYDPAEFAQRFPQSSERTMRWYLCRCFEDRDLMTDPQSCLMTEHVWMFDAKARHVEKVDVKMEVTMGEDRDRKSEVLVINPTGVTAKNQENMEDPGVTIARRQRREQLLKIEGYLQVFRDYNWEGLRDIWEKNLRDPSKVLVSAELIQKLIDEGRLKDTPQMWEQLKLDRPKEKVPSTGSVQLPTQRFKRR